ncbi:Glycosyl hydrolases family 16 [Geosmithia morbida]|uniref:chitinase n=1 Tax=Geosmithia morbida TaxID=1094350 RepID=A0A9P4YXC3_9HYPO|nr:Glycosyl hydrolases family 16 [Geosmithia morbida]KAF4123519.1 Glycosyl hydrolases family 16 [Geosmithia morbida]
MWRQRLLASTVTALLVMSSPVIGCNPLESTECPADAALGMAIDVDFTQGAVDSFTGSGSPDYGSDGVTFTVSKGGDAPQLNSIFTIMFGRVEVTMKAAPGAGIVSSLVLESDTLDEIDMEWLGSDPDEVQSNYFGKGQTTTWNRGQFHQVPGTQTGFITYTVDWTEDRIVWMADGTVLRTLEAADAEDGQYPQTPMQVKMGAWAGGDPDYNPSGTVKWARGPTVYSDGPFSMVVRSVAVTDYSTGSEYRYTDTSGSWQSIEAVGGEVNGNVGQDDVTATATATALVTSAVSVPVGGGIGTTATQTGWPWDDTTAPTVGSIPDGWRMTSEGKLIRDSAASLTPRPAHLLPLVLAAVVLLV